MLSQNQLGSKRSSFDEDSSQAILALSHNRTLERLYLDMNPLNETMGRALDKALDSNTTLQRLGVLTIVSPSTPALSSTLTAKLRYKVALNEAGRGMLRNAQSLSTKLRAKLLPVALSRIRTEPHLSFGLLRDDPSLLVHGLAKQPTLG